MAKSKITAPASVVFTDHALKRLRQRRLTREMVISAVQSPDKREREADGDTEFIRTINGRKVHVIGLYLADERKWLIKSTWVRGEEDPIPFWQRALNWLRGMITARSRRRP
jgi:hypothetical protein